MARSLAYWQDLRSPTPPDRTPQRRTTQSLRYSHQIPHVPVIATRRACDAAGHRCLPRRERPDADATRSAERRAPGSGCLVTSEWPCREKAEACLSREDAAGRTAARHRRMQPRRQSAAAALPERHVWSRRTTHLRPPVPTGKASHRQGYGCKRRSRSSRFAWSPRCERMQLLCGHAEIYETAQPNNQAIGA